MIALSLLACAPPPLPPGDATRPDIVLVSIDSLRPDHVGAYGYPRPTSPFLDRLAEDGLRFAEARSASPWTLPSHLTMLSGLWPTAHNVIEDDRALADDAPWVPERLRAAGWRTAAFVSTVYVSGAYGFARGFDRYEDYGIRERDNLKHPVRMERVVNDALAQVKAAGDGAPVFLFLHTYDVHYPYRCPAPYDTRFDRAGTPESTAYRTYQHYLKRPLTAAQLQHQVAQYDECVAYVDAQLARLYAAFEDSGRAAWWIVTADHGEEFGERGSWGHAHTLHREALRVPLIVSGPGVAPEVRQERAGTVDVASTIAALAGLGTFGQGVDLRGPVPERPFVGETARFETARLSWEEGDRRLDLDLRAREARLYDTRSDPGEKNDLANAEPTRVADMQRALLGFVGAPWLLAEGATVRSDGTFWREGALAGSEVQGPARLGLWPPDADVRVSGSASELGFDGSRHDAPVRLSDATRQQLEALGYTQPGGAE